MLGNNKISRIFEHCGLMTDLGLILLFVKERLTALIVSEVTIFNHIPYKHIW